MQTMNGSLEPTFSLVFINYQSAKYLERSLESLYREESAEASFEVIVVNNDPSESGKLRSLQGKSPFRLVESQENRGFAQAANAGALLAKGRLIGFINPDTLWKEPILSRVDTAFAEPSTGILGLNLVNESGEDDPWDSGQEVTLFGILLNHLSWKPSRKSENALLQEVSWVSGGSLFIRKPLFERLRGFDEAFFLYFEDVDLCLRARKMGYRVKKARFLPLLHYGGKSHDSFTRQKKHYYASQDTYFRKHRPFFERLLLGFLRRAYYGT